MVKNALIVVLTAALVVLALVKLPVASLQVERGLEERSAQAEGGWTSLLAEVAGDPALGGAGFGFCLLDEEGEIVAAWESELPLIPASTFKTLTTATALETLGPEFRFETRLVAGASPGAATIPGELVIAGGGDPTLADEDLKRWAAELAAAGLKQVGGGVVGDASIFGGQMVGDFWGWGDVGNGFGAPVAGLNLGHNRFVARFRPGERVGEAAGFLGSEPDIPQVIWRNRVTTGPSGSGDGVMIYGGPNAAAIELTGTVPAGRGEFRVSGAVPDPALLAAQRLTDHLEAAGVAIGKAPSTGERESSQEWARHQSAPLVEIIGSLHRTSNNLEAEAVYRMIGVEAGMGPAAAIRSHWARRGLDLGNTRIVDGSGLSRADYISAETLARLQHVTGMGPHGELYRDSLHPGYDGAVRWKGGAMSAVRSWCGFVRTEGDGERSFAMIFNHYPDGEAVARARDRLVEAMRTAGEEISGASGDRR